MQMRCITLVFTVVLGLQACARAGFAPEQAGAGPVSDGRPSSDGHPSSDGPAERGASDGSPVPEGGGVVFGWSTTFGASSTDHGRAVAVKVNLISNAATWSDELTRVAADAGLWNAAFSLDGLGPSHDHVRRRPGSFREVTAALESCRAARLAASVVTHVNQRNLGELGTVHELLAGLGVSAWQLQIGTPAGELGEHPDLWLAPRDLLRVVPLLAELRARPTPMEVVVSDNIGYYGKYERALRDPEDVFGFWIGCRAGLQNLGVESNGNVKGCLSLASERHACGKSYVEGNLRYSSLAELWERPGGFAATRGFREEDLGGFCRRCPYRDICRGGCLWVSATCSDGLRENPYCFFRVAVESGALDLLDPADAELVRAELPDLIGARGQG